MILDFSPVSWLWTIPSSTAGTSSISTNQSVTKRCRFLLLWSPSTLMTIKEPLKCFIHSKKNSWWLYRQRAFIISSINVHLPSKHANILRKNSFDNDQPRFMMSLTTWWWLTMSYRSCLSASSTIFLNHPASCCSVQCLSSYIHQENSIPSSTTILTNLILTGEWVIQTRKFWALHCVTCKI